MGKIDTGGAAFPQVGFVKEYPEVLVEGMTWLDECAMRAMQGLVHALEMNEEYKAEDLAFNAYEIARAMLAEKRRLEKE